jgi:hypothetical protein
LKVDVYLHLKLNTKAEVLEWMPKLCALMTNADIIYTGMKYRLKLILYVITKTMLTGKLFINLNLNTDNPFIKFDGRKFDKMS